MRERMRRVSSRLQCYPPVIGAGVVIFVIAVFAAGGIRRHEAAVIQGVRYALAAILVTGAAVTAWGVLTAVGRPRCAPRPAEDEPDLSPFRAAHDGSTWSSREIPGPSRGIPGPHAPVACPGRPVIPSPAPAPEPEPARPVRTEVPATDVPASRKMS